MDSWNRLANSRVRDAKAVSFLSRFDCRQIGLIEKKMLLFEYNKIDLFNLRSELDVILSALENISDSWKAELQSKINFLGMIHDGIQDGSISRWKGDFKEDLRKTIAGIKQNISDLLNEYLKVPDSRIKEIAIEGDATWLICPNCYDAWESMSSDAMVVCPQCEQVCHNPRFKLTKFK